MAHGSESGSGQVASVQGLRLRDLGEDALLAQLFPRLPRTPSALVGPGDDAAVLAAPDGRVVATTDVLVEGRDFRREWSSGADVGWKAAAQNLADVAAMGARPTGLLVALAAPPDLEVAWALELADGLAGACAGTGAGVVGGDLSGAGEILVAVTALGDLEGRAPVLRSGARPGDVVAVCGRQGWSAAGLDALRAGQAARLPAVVQAHRRPEPPYAAGPAAARAGATALLDVSDGLLRDLGRVARASGVTVDLDPPPGQDRAGAAAAPLFEAARVLLAARAAAPGGAAAVAGGPTGEEATDAEVAAVVAGWWLGGGEDHALAGCFPSGAALPPGFRAVGRVLARVAGHDVLVDGRAPGAVLGWDHFR